MDNTEALKEALKKAGVPHTACGQVALAVEAHLQALGFSVATESPLGSMSTTATIVHELYSSMLKAGFDEDQAFSITMMLTEKQVDSELNNG